MMRPSVSKGHHKGAESLLNATKDSVQNKDDGTAPYDAACFGHNEALRALLNAVRVLKMDQIHIDQIDRLDRLSI